MPKPNISAHVTVTLEVETKTERELSRGREKENKGERKELVKRERGLWGGWVRR